MNNFILKSTIVLILFVALSGCDLKDSPISEVAASDFYQNKEEAQVGLNGVYGRFWWGFYNNSRWVPLIDNSGGTLQNIPNPSNIDLLSWDASFSKLQDNWTYGYDIVNRANTLLDKLADAKFSSTQAKNNISGQAKFLRALAYFNMVRLWGGVPLYTKATTDLSNINKPRSSKGEVYKQIVSDLKDAVEELSPYNPADHADGKATSGAAQALLAKVYAQQNRWSEAATAAKKVIDKGFFGLMKDYEKILDPTENKNNEEIIFAIQHLPGSQTSKLPNDLAYGLSPGSQTNAEGEGVVFFKEGGQGSASSGPTPSFFNTTPDTYRKYQTMRNEMPYYYPVASSNLVHETIALDRPQIVKYYYLNEDTGNLNNGIVFPVIRFSDILLTYAESLNEANGGPTTEAYDAINKVRARARGVGTSHEQPMSVYPPLSGLSQEDFRDSVLIEEAREFVAEGHRRNDLKRHKRFISNAKSRGINAEDYRKLFPIPVEELSRNPKLEQNPGY